MNREKMKTYDIMNTKSRCILTLVAAVVLLISMINIGWSITQYLGQMNSITGQDAENSQIVCIACKLISNWKKLSNGLSRKFQDGDEKCCADNPDQMSAILNIIHQKQSIQKDPVTYDLGNVTLKQVSAHKRLLPDDTSPNLSNNTNDQLQFDNLGHKTMTEHASNVEVLPSGYHILLSGIYHVYSSIEFKYNRHKLCQEYYVKTWRQTVVRSRANERQGSGVILSSTHTCCEDCSWDMETSYTAGTFFLQAGDHLHVEIPDIRLTNFQSETSYFGVVMVADL